MTIRDCAALDISGLLPLYAAVGWTNYTRRPEMLAAALAGSLLTLGAYEGEKLIGLIRAVGDGSSAVLIQDLLVEPAHQRRGVGTALVKALLARFPEIYQIQLLTDDRPETRAFYEALGFSDAAALGCRAYMRMK